MITERQFSTTFTSFWSEVTPLGESFVRAMNLAMERFDEPIEADTPPALNGFVNELGFRIAEHAWLSSGGDIHGVPVDSLFRDTEAYIRRLPRPETPGSEDIRLKAISDATKIGVRLLSILRTKRGSREVIFRPLFRGCALHDDCEGDLLLGSELWEVKSGDRRFRQTDVRQLLTYCALNYVTRSYAITDYRFANPRAGTMFAGSLHDLVSSVAGCEPDTLYREIVEYLSHPETST